ncbi:MAG: M1 family peptidase, partial [Acidobacteriota bacterium]
MVRRLTLVICLVAPIAVYALQSASPTAQTRPAASATTTTAVPRAIRRDVPLTNAIRRAYDAGTRDLSGRPGPNYWQLQTDYDISVRLDPATDTLTGTETIT